MISDWVARSVTGSPHGLFEALLHGDASVVRRLLDIGARFKTEPPMLFPVGNFSVLHAAALGGCAAFIPALVAAGAPLNATLALPDGELDAAQAIAPLRQLLLACGHPLESIEKGATTALALAVR